MASTITPAQFHAFAEENPEAVRELTNRAVAQRINAIRGIPGVSAEFVIEQALKGNDVTKAKAELADVLLAAASPKKVEEASRAAAGETEGKRK